MHMKQLALGVLGVLFLSACGGSDDAPPLKGERVSVLELQKTLEPDDEILSAQGLITPESWLNEYWPQAGGYPNHAMQNLTLMAAKGQALERVWSADIGQGSTDELPLTSAPIVVSGRIFTLDTESKLSAFDAKTGDQLWDVDVGNEFEDDPVIAGGIAYSDNALFVTNGFNEVLALSDADGKLLWRKSISAPSRAAPTILNGRVYVTTVNGRLLALSVRDGSVLWDYSGISEDAGLVGGASPGANNDIVVGVFSSGEITALRVENGSVAWSDSLAATRRFGGLSSISDIKAMPVLDKGLVVAMSFGGRLVAIDERSGSRVWQREVGGTQTPWVAGNHVFVLSAENQLIALGRDTGAVRWVTELPRFDDKDPIILTGPVLAGGRLIVTGKDGVVYDVDPETGEIMREWDAGASVYVPPIVAGGTLYLLSEDGKLSAYR